jgi:hypothetical protein
MCEALADEAGCSPQAIAAEVRAAIAKLEAVGLLVPLNGSAPAA